MQSINCPHSVDGVHADAHQIPEIIIYEALESEPQEVLIEVKISCTQDRIKKEVENIASEYGVSAFVMNNIINCESEYNVFARGDGTKSRGFVQIHEGYRPHVTDELAYDPKYPINFLAEKLAKGQRYLWACYRIFYN